MLLVKLKSQKNWYKTKISLAKRVSSHFCSNRVRKKREEERRKRKKKKKKRRRRKEEKEKRLSQKGKGFWFDSCKMVLFLGFGWGNFS